MLGQFPKFFRLISTHLKFKQLWKELFIHNQIISWLRFVLLGCFAPRFCSFSTIRHFFVILTGATTLIIFFLRFNLWRLTWFKKIKLQNQPRNQRKMRRARLTPRRVRERTWERGCHLKYSIHGDELGLMLLSHTIKKSGYSIHTIPDTQRIQKVPLWRAD